MNQEQALNTLISAVQVATKRGAFELTETEVILQAVKAFTTKPDAPTSEVTATEPVPHSKPEGTKK